MPTNNFKLFDENKQNMMADDDYAINQQRLNGVQSGIASSQLQNKTLYQTALMCYALAQLMAANGYDANDANAVSTFVNNLSSTVLQKVVDKASAEDVANKVANKWIDSALFAENMDVIGDTYLKLAGGTMTGNLILNSDPTNDLQAATKQYVDKCRFTFYTYVGTGTAKNENITVNDNDKIIIIFPMLGFKSEHIFINDIQTAPTSMPRTTNASFVGNDRSDAYNFVWRSGNKYYIENQRNATGSMNNTDYVFGVILFSTT